MGILPERRIGIAASDPGHPLADGQVVVFFHRIWSVLQLAERTSRLMFTKASDLVPLRLHFTFFHTHRCTRTFTSHQLDLQSYPEPTYSVQPIVSHRAPSVICEHGQECKGELCSSIGRSLVLMERS